MNERASPGAELAYIWLDEYVPGDLGVIFLVGDRFDWPVRDVDFPEDTTWLLPITSVLGFDVRYILDPAFPGDSSLSGNIKKIMAVRSRVRPFFVSDDSGTDATFVEATVADPEAADRIVGFVLFIERNLSCRSNSASGP